MFRLEPLVFRKSEQIFPKSEHYFFGRNLILFAFLEYQNQTRMMMMIFQELIKFKFKIFSIAL